VLIHILLLALSLAFLPIVANSHWKPTGNEDPSVLIIGLLLGTIGLPLFLLSHHRPADPVLGVAHPGWHPCLPLFFPLQPRLADRADLLSVSHRAACRPARTSLCLVGGLRGLYAAVCRFGDVLPASSPRLAATGASPQHDPEGDWDPALRDYLLWLTPAAMGSWLLLAITNHITQNIAAIPFLWLCR